MSELDNPTFQAEGFYGRFREIFEPHISEAGLDPAVLSDPNAARLRNQIELRDHRQCVTDSGDDTEDTVPTESNVGSRDTNGIVHHVRDPLGLQLYLG